MLVLGTLSVLMMGQAEVEFCPDLGPEQAQLRVLRSLRIPLEHLSAIFATSSWSTGVVSVDWKRGNPLPLYKE